MIARCSDSTTDVIEERQRRLVALALATSTMRYVLDDTCLERSTELDRWLDSCARAQPVRTGAVATLGVTAVVSETELLERRELDATSMDRNDVIDARRAAGAGRSVELDRLAAELTEIVGTRTELRHQPRDVRAPGATVSSRRGRRHARTVARRAVEGVSRRRPGRASERPRRPLVSGRQERSQAPPPPLAVVATSSSPRLLARAILYVSRPGKG